ncbi:pilin [Streptomyces sp. 4N509B]|uniref:pilin n=1 Tax=Streptomyces sp. 4N509B TaxID=3457413 RepID=UPI003FD5A87F
MRAHHARSTGRRDLGGPPMRLIPPARRARLGRTPATTPAPATAVDRRGAHRAGRRGRRLAVAVTVATVLLVIAAPAHARSETMLAAATSLDTVLNNLRNWIMGIAATLATVMLSIGGVIRMLAGGDPGEIERSNRAFKSAAWGYGIAALAPLVVEILKGIVGE